MTLKERLDVIWLDNRVRCPNHIVWWRQDSFDNKAWGTKENWNIWWSKGRRINFKGKPKKGYSWLNKGSKAWIESQL